MNGEKQGKGNRRPAGSDARLLVAEIDPGALGFAETALDVGGQGAETLPVDAVQFCIGLSGIERNSGEARGLIAEYRTEIFDAMANIGEP